MKKRRNIKKKNSITKKSYFNVSHINLANSSLNLSQSNMKNSILSLKLLENLKNQKPKKKRKNSKPVILFENLNNVYKANFSRKNSLRRKTSIHRNFENYQNLKKNKKNLYNNFQEKFELPKLKKKFSGEFLKSIDDYKIIFGEKENLKINLQQLKLLLGHLRIIGNFDANWECGNLKEEKFVNFVFDVLKGDCKKIDFGFLRVFLVLFNLLFEEGLAFLGFGEFGFEDKNGNEKNFDHDIVVRSKNLEADENWEIEKKKFVVENAKEIGFVKIGNKKKIDFEKIDSNKFENKLNFRNNTENNIENKKNIDNFIRKNSDKNKNKKVFKEEIKLKKNDFSFSENFNKKQKKEIIQKKITPFKNFLFPNSNLKKKDLKILEMSKNSFFEEYDSESEKSSKKIQSTKKRGFQFDKKKKKKGNSINLDFIESSRNFNEDKYLNIIKKQSLYKIISEKNKFDKSNYFQSVKIKKRKSEKLFSAIVNLKNEKKFINIFKNDNIKMVVNRFSIENKLNKEQKKKLVCLLEKKKEQCFFRKNSVI